MRFLQYLLFHIVRLFRNIVHFFFRILATISFIAAMVTFSDYLVQYGFESGTGWLLLGASFIFSLLPWFYDKMLINLIPEEEMIYL